jgi:hypothetical protein
MSEKEHPELIPESIPAQVDGFELKKTACCYFLKEEETKNMVKLNDSSALIWQVCTGEWAVGEIIDVLKESYPDSADSMQDDVYQALGLLLNEGAIEICSAAA